MITEEDKNAIRKEVDSFLEAALLYVNNGAVHVDIDMDTEHDLEKELVNPPYAYFKIVGGTMKVSYRKGDSNASN